MQRIELLASLAKGSNSLLDLGCDHAYVLIDAIKKYNVKSGIASDVSDGPLNLAKENIIKNNLLNNIKLIKSNFFKNINEYFDTCIIAGMGGLLIKDIINNSLDKLDDKKLILEPNNNREVLRHFLNENNFKIIDEYSLYDSNKYYEIIVVIKGSESLTDFELNYGPILLQKRKNDFIKYYKFKYDFLSNVINNIKNEEEKNIKLKELDDYKKIIEDNYGEKISFRNN